MPYCMYLRKSRADIESEARGEGETLARHERALFELAQRYGLSIDAGNVYREIVSGDSIADRPVVQRLLREVEAGLWSGVLVMDADRLARGETIDQGMIAQAFRYSGTKIITPMKTYDPNNEMDEEFFEFSLFMARREYKMIKRRLQRGRIASVKEGRYMGTRPVFGYERVKIQGGKGYTLKIVPEKAAIVRMIYDWYAHGMDGQPASSNVIADRLTKIGVKTDLGHDFTAARVRDVLQNPTYIGKVQWNQKKTEISIVDGEKVKTRKKSEEHILVDGLHEAIIDEALYKRVQGLFATHARNPARHGTKAANPLAGLVKCEVCGKALVRRYGRNGRPDTLRCSTAHCPALMTYIVNVERELLNVLKMWLRDYAPEQDDAQAQSTAQDSHAEAIKIVDKEVAALKQQKNRLHDLLERGVYDADVYFDRMADVNKRLGEMESERKRIVDEARTEKNTIIALLPQVKTVVEGYDAAPTVDLKNQLLKSVIQKVILHKSKRCTRADDVSATISLEIYPRVVE